MSQHIHHADIWHNFRHFLFKLGVLNKNGYILLDYTSSNQSNILPKQAIKNLPKGKYSILLPFNMTLINYNSNCENVKIKHVLLGPDLG